MSSGAPEAARPADPGFYVTDPSNPSAPVFLDEWHGIRVGDQVRDAGPVAPLEGEFTVSAIYWFKAVGGASGSWVTVILDGGALEISAENLRRVDG
jgi:hypothetical protein